MFKIIGKRIEMTRGDTPFIEVIPIADPRTNELYILGEHDTLIMTVKREPSRTDYHFRKTLTRADYKDGNRLAFKIGAADTASMRFGDYWYDVQLSINNGEIIQTIVPPSTFRILEEVTY